MIGLSEDEGRRYHRQMILQGWGEAAQSRLKAARVAVIGAGGLGSTALLQLAAAGFGMVRVIDKDRVDLSNLNRQVLHWEADLGRSKVDSACRKLRRANHHVELEAVEAELDAGNADRLLGDCDGLIDGLDSLPARLLVNEVAVRRRVPLFHGAVWGLEGRATTVLPGRTPCLRCLYGDASADAATVPVVGVTPALIAAVQVTEAVKHFTGIGELLAGQLLVYDGASMLFLKAAVARDPDCPVCGGLSLDSPMGV